MYAPVPLRRQPDPPGTDNALRRLCEQLLKPVHGPVRGGDGLRQAVEGRRARLAGDAVEKQLVVVYRPGGALQPVQLGGGQVKVLRHQLAQAPVRQPVAHHQPVQLVDRFGVVFVVMVVQRVGVAPGDQPDVAVGQLGHLEGKVLLHTEPPLRMVSQYMSGKEVRCGERPAVRAACRYRPGCRRPRRGRGR